MLSCDKININDIKNAFTVHFFFVTCQTVLTKGMIFYVSYKTLRKKCRFGERRVQTSGCGWPETCCVMLDWLKPTPRITHNEYDSTFIDFSVKLEQIVYLVPLTNFSTHFSIENTKLYKTKEMLTISFNVTTNFIPRWATIIQNISCSSFVGPNAAIEEPGK